MSKHTVAAPANIAFVKYWGARDLAQALPLNASISMTLDVCRSTTTVEHLAGPGADEILLADASGALEAAPDGFRRRIAEHLGRLRQAAGSGGRFVVATRNSFPAAAGLASSASGFAALTLATAGALGWQLSAREASVWARRSGSGSAARSVLGGYVEWPMAEDTDEGSWAESLAPADHWPLADVIVLVETEAKEVSSLDGHRVATTSPHFAARLAAVPGRLARVRRAIAERDLAARGRALEEEAIELHLGAMSSRPPIFYWKPATLTVLAAVRALRGRGLGAWATMDAGANVHVISALGDGDAVAAALAALPGVVGIIRDQVGPGPATLPEGLF